MPSREASGCPLSVVVRTAAAAVLSLASISFATGANAQPPGRTASDEAGADWGEAGNDPSGDDVANEDSFRGGNDDASLEDSFGSIFEDVSGFGPYVHLLANFSVGESLRFNNPFRLSWVLGKTPESLSRTPLFGSIGVAASMGDPDGFQHGLSLQWSFAFSGVPQSVIAPSYLLVVDGLRPWLMTGRIGLPVVLNPDPTVGGEFAVGGAYMLTAGFGLQAELVGNVFYGAATWETKITVIPMLSLQIGVIVDYEILP